MEQYQEDRERSVNKGPGWTKFRTFLSQQYEKSGLDLDAILKKVPLKRDPVISYGLIEFAFRKNNQGDPCILYHVYRRRNTTEYDTLIRGFAQKNQLYDLISLLSRDERDRILNNSWEELWDDYWIDHDGGSYAGLKSQSKRRFDEIKNLLKLLDDDLPCKIYKRPYIFPKGKPNKNEEGVNAALREAREETKGDFSEKDGYLYFNSPIIQYYIGSDGKQYIDYYYIWCSYNVYSSPCQRLYNIIPNAKADPVTLGDSKGNFANTDSSNNSKGNFTNQSAINGLRRVDSGEDVDDANLKPLIKFIREQESLAADPTSNNTNMQHRDRLRNRTISHELESDAWIEIPLFNSVRDKLEWASSVDPYQEFGLFKRHFNAILEIHNHFC